jgi:hypothetical protein
MKQIEIEIPCEFNHNVNHKIYIWKGLQNA